MPLDVPYLPSELEIGPQAAPQAPAAPPASSDQAAVDGAKGAKVCLSQALLASEKLVPTLCCLLLEGILPLSTVLTVPTANFTKPSNWA